MNEHSDAGDFALPVGTVTFVLTDIVGSSRLWETDPGKAKRALTAHHRLIDAVVGRRGGARPQEQGEGDSTLSAFARASDACRSALEIQESLAAHPDTADIQIRTGIHTGEASLMDEGNYLAAPVNRCARLRALAHPGQILMSRTTWELASRDLGPDMATKDLGLRRLRDLTGLEHVFQLHRPDGRSEFPPLASLDAFTNNLPIQWTSFVGREDEVRELVALVLRNRVVTLTGSGGCGKTRLSLQVAAEVVGEFADGVWFVELAPVTDADQVVSEVANALFLQPGPMQSTLDALRAFLKERTCLIVLDNCEHVVQECADLAGRLLQQCPGVSLVATSREPLGLPGEVIWRVPPLSHPGVKQVEGPTESFLRLDSLRLFAERATQVRPDFVIDASSVATVAEICRRLDGIPLAIELAAARVRLMPPAEILAALKNSLRVLRGGSRTALPRQQTLEASVEWSYSLLSEPEQLLLDRLAVFWGFTLESVEEACGFDPIDSADVLDLVASLADKSLVQVEDDRFRGRYRLLETIRQFVTPRLVERGEWETMRLRHSEYFFKLLQDGREPLERGDIAWRDRLDEESDNIREAVLRALGSGDGRSVSRVAFPLSLLAAPTGRGVETMGWLDQALASLPENETELRAITLLSQAVIANYRLDILAQLRVATEAHSLFSALGQEVGIGRSCAQVGFAHALLIDFDLGMTRMEEGLEKARRCGDSFGTRNGLMLLGFASLFRDPNESREYLEECLERYPTGTDSALNTAFLSRNDVVQGRWQAVLSRSAEAARIAREQHQRLALASALSYQAEALLNVGKFEDARPLLMESQRMSLEAQWPVLYAYTLSVEGRLGFALGDLAVAREATTRSLALIAGISPTMSSFAQLSLARAEFQDGDLEAARSTLAEASESAERSDLRWQLATAAYLRASIALRESNLDEAFELSSEALTRFERIDSMSGMIEALELVAEIAFASQRYEQAALLIAASQAQRDRTDFALYPVYQVERERFLASLRATLADAFQERWAAGLAVDLRSAVDLARKPHECLAPQAADPVV